MTTEFAIRKNMVEIGRRMYEKDLVAATDGNLSVLLDPETILITPTGSCLGFLKPAELVIINREGKILSDTARPTSEYRLHLEVYRQRKDVTAIVHGHPPICTAFTVAGEQLDLCVLPEVVFTLGAIPTIPYGTPTTDEAPRVIREYIGRCDAMILDRHGTLTVGESLTGAYYKLEKIEHTARVILTARMLGDVKVLEKSQVDRLMQVRSDAGLRGNIIHCVCATPDASGAAPSTDEDQLTRTITSEVLKIIQG
ncbi:MAG: class II aldolase/adducin family protein [Candidatus Auribacterota bacterium]|nr:class II aldolase/adducin family protein [Candidatus Auribacterota bacterium]